MTSDPDRKAVYAAEEQLAAWLDLLTPERASLTIDGTTYVPEVEPRFTDPAAVKRYVDQVLAHLRQHGSGYDDRELIEVTVRARQGRTMAHYEFDTCTIAVPPFEIGGGWALRGLVALHEISHHLHGESGHGAPFRAVFLRVLEDLGNPVLAELLHLAFVSEGLVQVTHDLDDGTLARIAKLLRQAETTANEHERAAFLTKAQGLATQHSIALAVARAHTARQERREEPVYEHVVIGEPGKKGLARYVRLLLNIAHANDLRCTIRTDSTSVTLYGFAEDIAVTQALYRSLLVQMVADCQVYLASGERDDTLKWDARKRRYVRKPVATITARMAFYEAYAERIGDRLTAARRATLAAADAVVDTGDPERSSEAALALRQKELDVHDFFADALRRNNVRATWSGDRRSAADQAPTAADEGIRAAARARLSNEKAIGETG